MKCFLSMVAATALAAASTTAVARQAADANAAPESLPAAATRDFAATTAPTGGCVALTAVRGSLFTTGGPQLVSYDDPPVASGPYWINRSVLAIPRGCGGRYLLSLSFTHDTAANRCGAGQTGTTDDAFVDLRLMRGGQDQRLGSKHGAWAGQKSGERPVGVSTIAVVLNEGDLITTWSRGDNNQARCMHDVTFTALTIN